MDTKEHGMANSWGIFQIVVANKSIIYGSNWQEMQKENVIQNAPPHHTSNKGYCVMSYQGYCAMSLGLLVMIFFLQVPFLGNLLFFLIM